MVIDFHTHVFPENIAAPTLGRMSRKAHIPLFADGTADGLAASMEAAGVDRSVILPVATRPGQVTGINDSAAVLNAAMGARGLLSFGSIHPDCENWREELRRVGELGLKGIKIHPVYQGVHQDDARYLRILERAGELGLIVVTHSGIDIGYPDLDHCSPAKLRRAVRRAGPVHLVAAHMGGWKQWDEAQALLADTQVLLDTSFSTGLLTPLHDGYYRPEDLPLLDETRFLDMVRAFGAHRILFGTDSPWSSQRESVAWLQALPLRREETEAILGTNARQLLGI